MFISAVVLEILLQLFTTNNQVKSSTYYANQPKNQNVTNLTTDVPRKQTNLSTAVNISTKNASLNLKDNPLSLKDFATFDEFCTKLMDIVGQDKICSCDLKEFKGICKYFATRNSTPSCSWERSTRDNMLLHISIGINISGVVENLLCLLIIANNKRNTMCRKLTGVLALVDLIFSFLSLLPNIPKFWTCHWIYGAVGCKLIVPMIHSTGIMALGFILIISLERFNGIVKPLLNSDESSSKKIFLMGFVNIFISFAFVTPTIVILKMEMGGPKTCGEEWSFGLSLIYSWFSLIITFVFPIMVISYIYIRIVKSLRKSQYRIKNILSKKDQLRRKKEDDRITTIIISLLISFVLLVSPNRIYWMLHDYGVLKKLPLYTYGLFNYFSRISYDIHACINPIIYSLVDKKFRQSFLHLFCKMTCQRRNTLDNRTKRNKPSVINNNTTAQLPMSVVNEAFTISSH